MVIVAAPGGRIVDGDPPASAARRRDPPRDAPRRRTSASCRAPLAEPRLDFRVDRRQRAWPTRCAPGEYIQIIDVAGPAVLGLPRLPPRASSRAASSAASTRPTTRTLMGNAYPTPGPARQVLRRRHGPAGRGRARHRRAPRHLRARLHAPSTTRTWATPGTSTAPRTSTASWRAYGIAARKGWAALNFFYNTGFDADNVLLVRRALVAAGRLRAAARDDRPASARRRRARTTSTRPTAGSCTDVHVRVYSPENRFSMAIAHRVTADAEPVLTQETAFHPRTSRADRELRRVPRLLAAALLQQRGRDRRVLGVPREGRRRWTSRRCASGRSSARTPRR